MSVQRVFEFRPFLERELRNVYSNRVELVIEGDWENYKFGFQSEGKAMGNVRKNRLVEETNFVLTCQLHSLRSPWRVIIELGCQEAS